MKPSPFRLVILLLVTIAWTAPAATSRLPNIVIIFTDDQGYADVGVFGAKGFKTPNLDRMAAQGCKFTNFHVAQPVCSASRTALLTGCYPNRLGIHGALGPNAKHGINDNEMTLAELLKQKGYATGMAGKWHLGRPTQFLPTHHGFDEYFGLPYSNDMWPSHPEAKRGTYPTLPLIEGDQVIDSEITPDEQNNLTTWYTERAVKFIERNKDGPFFFYLAHSMPHVPLHVSDKFRGKSQQGSTAMLSWRLTGASAKFSRRSSNTNLRTTRSSFSPATTVPGSATATTPARLGRCARVRGPVGKAARASRASCAGPERFRPAKPATRCL
jgi:arylsulfatase